ncbi:hypothetical protein Nepgr_017447 [Nepenthes gracilis]|uniref:Uncharacterized protein n=1 Tax=Nepenthes gracilis TaxID=150966 RepID=A0AAD3SSN0_NEPGR|nr:hypothetical protein Nepgr_017447 [Nepenthes gracilis]
MSTRVNCWWLMLELLTQELVAAAMIFFPALLALELVVVVYAACRTGFCFCWNWCAAYRHSQCLLADGAGDLDGRKLMVGLLGLLLLRHFACQWVLDDPGHYLQQAEELATAWRLLCKMEQNPTGWIVGFYATFSDLLILPEPNSMLEVLDSNGSTDAAGGIGCLPAVAISWCCICRLPGTPVDTGM